VAINSLNERGGSAQPVSWIPFLAMAMWLSAFDSRRHLGIFYGQNRPNDLNGENPMAKRKHAFQVIVEQDEAGYFVAECPALKACYTQGKSYEEVMENIKDVLTMCLKDLKAQGKKVPKQAEIIGVRRVEVLA
jgi:predicted RNase H-like HicB family nuclease